MRIVTGNVVRGENFLNRENIIAKAWDFIESDSHLLIAAPRRIWKTVIKISLGHWFMTDTSTITMIPVSIDTILPF